MKAYFLFFKKKAPTTQCKESKKATFFSHFEFWSLNF
jgi:hypothetical protein